jgi:membrane protease YdiL (CAAX protease family)
VVGILLAHVYETEGNLWVAVSFHALFNSFSLVMLLLINQSGSLIAP